MSAILLNEHEVAARLGISHRTLQKSRCTGRGIAIPFVKLGNAVRYRQEDIDAFIDSGWRRSTSDPGRELA